MLPTKRNALHTYLVGNIINIYSYTGACTLSGSSRYYRGSDKYGGSNHNQHAMAQTAAADRSTHGPRQLTPALRISTPCLRVNQCPALRQLIDTGGAIVQSIIAALSIEIWSFVHCCRTDAIQANEEDKTGKAKKGWGNRHAHRR